MYENLSSLQKKYAFLMQNHGVETKFEKIVLPEIPLNITMIGNEKFEPFTLWNDIELR